MPRKLPPVWVTRESASRYGLTYTQRAVLLCLWDHANGAFEAWPSNPTMAAEIGCHINSVKNSTRVLHERRFIRRADGRSPFEPSENTREVVKWIVEPSPFFIDTGWRLAHQVS